MGLSVTSFGGIVEGVLLFDMLDSCLHRYELHPFFRISDCSASLCPESDPPPACEAPCSHPAAAWLPAPRSRPSHRTTPSRHRWCASTPALPRHVFDLPACLDLLQRRNHLRLRMLALRHPPALPNTISYSVMCGVWGAGQYVLLQPRRTGFDRLQGSTCGVQT